MYSVTSSTNKEQSMADRLSERIRKPFKPASLILLERLNLLSFCLIIISSLALSIYNFTEYNATSLEMEGFTITETTEFTAIKLFSQYFTVSILSRDPEFGRFKFINKKQPLLSWIDSKSLLELR